MAFLPISFHADLILNRLRNERQIADNEKTDDERRKGEDRAEQEARAKLAFVKQRLRELAAWERKLKGIK
jgi:hypothetical protein